MAVTGRMKADQIRQAEANIVATTCANCKVQLSHLIDYHRLDAKWAGVHDLVLNALVVPAKKPSPPVEIDDQGYLKDPSSWDHNIARSLASEEAVSELTESHWQVLEYIRNYYNSHKAWPIPGRIHRDTGVDPRQLFPGSLEAPFKIAGLTRPGDHVCWDAKGLKGDS